MSRRPRVLPGVECTPAQDSDLFQAEANPVGGARAPLDGAGFVVGRTSRDARREAHDAAIAYLARAARSKEEVVRHLSMRRQVPAESAREVVDALEREGLLNDSRLAERVVEAASGGRKAQSRAMLVQHLRRRGIAEDIIRRAVSAESIDELSAARRLAQAKWQTQGERLRRRASDEGEGDGRGDGQGDGQGVSRDDRMKALRSVGAHLGRKGFAGDVIRQVLEELRTDAW